VTRRLFHPLTLVALIALVMLSVRLAGAQIKAGTTTGTRRIAVATHTLARGTVLIADDFALRDTTVRGASDTTQVSAGWVTRRIIAAGEVLHIPAVERPQVVSANQSVQVEFQDQNIRLTIRGVATRNGSVGERVGVRTETGRRMEATVVAPGRVRVDSGFNQ
jgi:flagella basal body P-ring formation protein FlgA